MSAAGPSTEESFAIEQIFAERLCFRRKSARPDKIAVRAFGDQLRGDYGIGLVGLNRQGELLFNLGGEPLVVIVQKSDPLTGGILHADVARVGAADALLQGDVPQTLTGHCVQDCASGVVRSVNDHNDLDGVAGLRAHTGHRPLEKIGTVARGNHCGDEGSLHSRFR